MPSTGTAMAQTAMGPARTETHCTSETALAPQVRQSAHWFFWVVAATVMDSLFVIVGSTLHRFTGFGVTALVDRSSGGSHVLHVLANGWAAVPFLLFGFCALEGRKWAFAVGLAAYAFDAALLAVAHDYFSIPFHAFVFLSIYRGLSALKRSPHSQANTAS